MSHSSIENFDIMALINKHKPAEEDLMKNIKSLQTTAKVSEPLALSELDSLVTGMKTKLLETVGTDVISRNIPQKDSEDDERFNDNLINDNEINFKFEDPSILQQKKIALKDIDLNISEIKPSEFEAPRTIIDEQKGLKVVVNFTQGHPAQDVTVLVITVINQGPIAIANFQFDASVTKPCKLRLLAASGTELPGILPFKPPTQTINQVILLLNPTLKPTNLIAILTYNLEDDPDPYKESIEVKNIPFVS